MSHGCTYVQGQEVNRQREKKQPNIRDHNPSNWEGIFSFLQVLGICGSFPTLTVAAASATGLPGDWSVRDENIKN